MLYSFLEYLGKLDQLYDRFSSLIKSDSLVLKEFISYENFESLIELLALVEMGSIKIELREFCRNNKKLIVKKLPPS